VSAAAQWSTIGWMAACGLAMGLAFDLYRVAARKFRLPRWLLPALDLVYWAAATVAVFRVLLGHNHGEVRLYVYLVLGIGVTGYFGLFSPHVLRIAARLLDAGIRAARWIGRMLRIVTVTPVTLLVRSLAKLLDVLFLVTAAILVWIGRLLLVPFRPVGRFIWKKLLPVRRLVRSWLDTAGRWKDRLKAAWDLFRRK
jgi:spore cortex biosynthesis protein YabQ